MCFHVIIFLDMYRFFYSSRRRSGSNVLSQCIGTYSKKILIFFFWRARYLPWLIAPWLQHTHEVYKLCYCIKSNRYGPWDDFESLKKDICSEQTKLWLVIEGMGCGMILSSKRKKYFQHTHEIYKLCYCSTSNSMGPGMIFSPGERYMLRTKQVVPGNRRHGLWDDFEQ